MTGGYSPEQRFLTMVERSLAGDMAMENFSQIDHIWVHPDNAHFVGLKSPGETIQQFRVNRSLTIIVSNRKFTHNGYCEIKFSDGTTEPINLPVIQNTMGWFDLNLIRQPFEQSICQIGYQRLEGAEIRIQSLIGFVAVLYAKAPFTQVMQEMEIGDETKLPNVPFLVNHPFRVIVSKKKPLSADRKATMNWDVGTVDANGWFVGYRTSEEIARIPADFR